MKSKRSCFLMFVGLFMGALGLWAATEPPAQKPEKQAMDLSSLAISESIGKIETRHVKSESPRWVVHIQDVHAHFAAQENIAAILDQLNATYGIKTVAVEGGWHSTSLPKSWALPNSRKKQMLARALLEDHYLTGPGYAALFSQMPLTLVGIEEGKLYEENRKIYLNHLSQREEIVKKVDTLGQEIARLKGRLFNPDLLNFDQALLEFRKGKKAEKFLPSLISKTETLGVDISPFGQIVLLKDTLTAEKSLNKEKLKAEGGRLVLAFKGKRLSFEELLRSGKVPAEKLQFYPELQKFSKLIRLQDQIEHRPLFSQLDQVVSLVKEKLMTREEEKALDGRSERFELARKIILFQATPDDLKFYSSMGTNLKNSPSPAPLPLEGGEDKGERVALSNAIFEEMQKASLGEALKLGLRFYEVAKKRDAIFFEKIMNHPKLRQNIAVVAGGFHTEGLSEQLEEAGISYMVITPDLAGEVPNEAAYFEKLKISPIGTQTLPFFLRYLRPSFDQNFYNVHESTPEREILTRVNEITTVPDLVSARLAGPPIAAAAASAFDLENLKPEEQMGFVEDLRKLQDGKRRIGYVIRGKTLKELFEKNPLAAAAWNTEIFSKRENTIALLYDTPEDIPNETLGVSALLKRIPTDELETVARSEARKYPVAVFGLDYSDLKRDGNMLFIPLNRIAGALLARPILESVDPRFASLNVFSSEMLSLLDSLLLRAYTQEGIKKAA